MCQTFLKPIQHFSVAFDQMSKGPWGCLLLRFETNDDHESRYNPRVMDALPFPEYRTHVCHLQLPEEIVERALQLVQLLRTQCPQNRIRYADRVSRGLANIGPPGCLLLGCSNCCS